MTIIRTEYEYGLLNTRTRQVNDYTYGYPNYGQTAAYMAAVDARRDWERDTGDTYEVVARTVKRGAWIDDL